jgi:hypothetical protein
MTSIDERISRLIALDVELLEVAELSVRELKKMLLDPRTPAAARITAINTGLKANGLSDGLKHDAGGKEPHEMTADELQQQIARLRREAVDRSRLIIDAVPVQIAAAKKGVFE